MSAPQTAKPAAAPTAADLDLDAILAMTDAKRSQVFGKPDAIESIVILMAKGGGLGDIRRSLPQGSTTQPVRFLAAFVKCARREIESRGMGKDDESRLFRCSLASILEALKLAAMVDVVPGDGRAYLIPYKDECKFELGAHGMRDVMRRSSGILDINDQAVYEGDEFEIELEGPNRGVRHKRKFLPGRKWVASYATALLEGDPRPIVEVIDAEDLAAIKSQAKAQGSLAWTKFADEMSRAKVLRRLSKRVPMRPDDAAALQAMDAANHFMIEGAAEAAEQLRKRAPIHATIDPADLSPSSDPNRGHDKAAPTNPAGLKLSDFADEEQELLIGYLERKAGIADQAGVVAWLAKWEAGAEELLQLVWDDYKRQKAQEQPQDDPQGSLLDQPKGQRTKGALK